MRYFLGTALFLLLFAACTRRKVPAGIFPQEKMESVMWDMMRAGQFLNSFVLSKDTAVDKVKESRRWYEKVYEMHKTTKLEFDKSYAYYRNHPALMKEIMDSISKKTLNLPPGQHNWNDSDSVHKVEGPSPIRRQFPRGIDSSGTKKFPHQLVK